jgi:hypothetical protein
MAMCVPVSPTRTFVGPKKNPPKIRLTLVTGSVEPVIGPSE